MKWFAIAKMQLKNGLQNEMQKWNRKTTQKWIICIQECNAKM